MAKFDFHFVPSPTGEISGQEVLKQTEDGINGVGATAAQSEDYSSEALAKAKQAVETANNAQSAASNATAEAEAAQEKVNTLAKVVSGYDEKISDAVTAAQGAVTTANGAASSATAAHDAADKAAQAAKASQAASEKSAEQAETAAANAAEAIGEAAKAAASASEAQAAAETARGEAQTAQSAASDSAATAKEAVANCYALRVTSRTLTDGGTVPVSALSPQRGVKAGDQIVDAVANVFEITEITQEDDAPICTVAKTGFLFVQAVSYATAQNLPEEQKSTARGNIDAASDSAITEALTELIEENGGA